MTIIEQKERTTKKEADFEAFGAELRRMKDDYGYFQVAEALSRDLDRQESLIVTRGLFQAWDIAPEQDFLKAMIEVVNGENKKTKKETLFINGILSMLRDRQKNVNP